MTLAAKKYRRTYEADIDRTMKPWSWHILTYFAHSQRGGTWMAGGVPTSVLLSDILSSCRAAGFVYHTKVLACTQCSQKLGLVQELIAWARYDENDEII